MSKTPVYDDAVDLLTDTYARAPSLIFARYALKTCNQQVGESLDVYFQKLKRLVADCNFLAASPKLHKEEAIRDAFVSRILSNEIRQRLLEDHDLSLQKTFNKARSLEIEQKNDEAYCAGQSQLVTPPKTIAKIKSNLTDCSSDKEYSAALIKKCMYLWEYKSPTQVLSSRRCDLL